MDKLVTKNGSVITISDSDIATLTNPKQPGAELKLGTPQGERLATTDVSNMEAFGYDYKTSRSLYFQRAKLDAETIAWLNAHWQVRLSDRWEATEPDEVRQAREYDIAMDSYYNEQQKRFEDENLSSVALQKPQIQKPQVSLDGQAWMYLDGLLHSSLVEKRIIAEKAIRSHLDDGISLQDAMAQASKNLDIEIQKMVMID